MLCIEYTLYSTSSGLDVDDVEMLDLPSEAFQLYELHARTGVVATPLTQ